MPDQTSIRSSRYFYICIDHTRHADQHRLHRPGGLRTLALPACPSCLPGRVCGRSVAIRIHRRAPRRASPCCVRNGSRGPCPHAATRPCSRPRSHNARRTANASGTGCGDRAGCCKAWPYAAAAAPPTMAKQRPGGRCTARAANTVTTAASAPTATAAAAEPSAITSRSAPTTSKRRCGAGSCRFAGA